MNTTDPSPDTLRAAFGHFPTGVAALCAQSPSGLVGMAVSTFVPVSLDPPLIAVCIQETSRTWPSLREQDRIGVSILMDDQLDAARALSKRDGDRFSRVRHGTAEGGGIRIDGCSTYFDCSLHDEVSAGDHLLALLAIHRVELTSTGGGPLVFHRSRFGRLAELG